MFAPPYPPIAGMLSNLVPRLGCGVKNTNLEHRKTLLQLDRASYCPLFRAELGFDAPIDFKSESGLWKNRRVERHVVRSGSKLWVLACYGESGCSDQRNEAWANSDDSEIGY